MHEDLNIGRDAALEEAQAVLRGNRMKAADASPLKSKGGSVGHSTWAVGTSHEPNPRFYSQLSRRLVRIQ